MTASFDKWEYSARFALAERGIGYHQATPLIKDARMHYEHSGDHDPEQVLGPPQQFAADVAADQPAAQARLDTHGKTPRDYLSDAVFGLALLGFPAALMGAWVAGSLTIPVTVAGLTGTALASLGVVAAQAGNALRAAGHPRLAPWGFGVTVALVVAAGLAFTQLPPTRVGQVPVLGILAVSLLLCWLLTRPSRATQPSERPDESGQDPADADAWFARLHALLIGRFDVPATRATALVNEARAHIAATGTAPGEEFPSLARYARDIAEGEMRQVPWWRSTTSGLLVRIAIPVLLLPAVAQAIADGRKWIAVGATALLLWLTWELLRAGRALLRHRRALARERRS